MLAVESSATLVILLCIKLAQGKLELLFSLPYWLNPFCNSSPRIKSAERLLSSDAWRVNWVKSREKDREQKQERNEGKHGEREIQWDKEGEKAGLVYQTEDSGADKDKDK